MGATIAGVSGVVLSPYPKKSTSVEFKADGPKGEFTALFAVFDNLDRQGDIIRKGAFLPALEAEPNPPVVWTHRWDIPPIGETLDADETDKGARGHGKLFVDDNPTAKQIYAAMKAGALKQQSFAYEIAEGGFILRDATDEEKTPRYDGMVRELTEFSALFEWGPTIAGANPETGLLDGPKSVEALLGLDEDSLELLRKALGVEEEDERLEKFLADFREALGPESKRGARNSSKDADRLQSIHDLAVENGAKCKAEEAVEDEESDEEKAARSEASLLLEARPR